MALQATDNSAKGTEARFEDYCDEVEKSAAWGGQLELEALSRAYQRHITVYSVGMPPVEMGKDFGGDTSAAQQSKLVFLRCMQVLRSACSCDWTSDFP